MYVEILIINVRYTYIKHFRTLDIYRAAYIRNIPIYNRFPKHEEHTEKR